MDHVRSELVAQMHRTFYRILSVPNSMRYLDLCLIVNLQCSDCVPFYCADLPLGVRIFKHEIFFVAYFDVVETSLLLSTV